VPNVCQNPNSLYLEKIGLSIEQRDGMPAPLQLICNGARP